MRCIEIHDSIDIHVCIHINFMSQLILLVREGRIDERNLCGFDLRDDLNYPGLWWSVSKQSGYHSIDYKESGGRGVERWVGCGAVWENFFEVQRCGSRIFCRGIVRRQKKKNLTEANIFLYGKVSHGKKSAHAAIRRIGNQSYYSRSKGRNLDARNRCSSWKHAFSEPSNQQSHHNKRSKSFPVDPAREMCRVIRLWFSNPLKANFEKFSFQSEKSFW